MPGRDPALGTPVALIPPPKSPGLVARVRGAVGEYIAGVTPGSFFSPGQPLAPVMPADEPKGRTFDFPIAYNQQIIARAYEPIGFQTLRTFADACTLCRLAIETVKDEMCRLSWDIVDRKSGSPDDPRADKIREFLRYPDKEHDLATWMRMAFEDMLVGDCATIYRRPNAAGGLYALEILDGTTISRKLDETGRTPVPPSVAYQQIIKGMPASNFTFDEILYAPRNLRPGHVYGQSPVEQLLLILNLALRRELHQLNYYVDGNIPDAIMAIPDLTTEEVKELQSYLDLTLNANDNPGARRLMKVMPDGKLTLTKTSPLFDIGDEYIARWVCFAFSISPQALVKTTTRATASTQEEAAMLQGMFPRMLWFKGVMDRILAQWFGAPDLEWSWDDPRDVDQLVQAQIENIWIMNGRRTINEVRQDDGDPPVPWGNEPPPAFYAKGQQPSGDGDGEEIPSDRKPPPEDGAVHGSRVPKGDPDGITAGAAEAKKLGGRLLLGARPGTALTKHVRESRRRRFRI